MKKILLMGAIGLCVFAFGQNNLSPAIGLGYTQKGGFSFSFEMKNKNSFGGYVAVRGLNVESDYRGGVDYSDISSVDFVDSETKDAKPFNISIGTIYNFRDSNFSLGAGLGYGIKQKVTTESIVYDFQYTSDEYGTLITVDKKTKITGELFVDYAFNKSLCNTLGLQAGYNTLAGAFGMIYYSF